MVVDSDSVKNKSLLNVVVGLGPRLNGALDRILTWEVLFYLSLMALAGVMRFWDLGTRAMHHDESLHAFFSLDFFGNYRHNPLMHGPFQFFGLNVLYNLFGESEVSARALAAASGTILVGMPYLLRDYLGRWASMIASLFILLSPTLLYFSRFARNDAYMAVWTLGLVICVWRYMAESKARYLYIGAGLLSLSFATKENSYITLLILVSFFFILWLRRADREGKVSDEITAESRSGPLRLPRPLAAVASGAKWAWPFVAPSRLAFVLLAGWVLAAILWSLDIYDIVGRVDATFSLVSLGVAVGIYVAALPWMRLLSRSGISPYRWAGRLIARIPFTSIGYRTLARASIPPMSGPGALWLLLLLLPLPLLGAAIGLFQGPVGLTLANPNSLEGTNPEHVPGIPDGAPSGEVSLAIAIGVIMYLLVIGLAIGLRWDWKKFLLSGLIFWGIFVLLYTTFFTNPGQGLGSGLWQSLGYWVAQQDVRRGGQPWYYYLLLSVAYEFLVLAVVLIGAAWLLIKSGKTQKLGNLIIQGLVAAVAMLLVLSTFWMPEASGPRLAIGSVLLVMTISMLAWYGRVANPGFLRSRILIADLAVMLLLLFNWEVPRLFEVTELGFFDCIIGIQEPLNTLILFGALGIITFRSMRLENRFDLFLVYWLASTLIIYAAAGEKMPWLMAHTALPLIILAARYIGRLVEQVRWRPRLNPRWAMAVIGVLAMGLLTYHSVTISVEAAYGVDREGQGEIPIEMLVYTQTSPDITSTMARINLLAQSTGLGPALPIVIDRTSGFEYPWRWYLRDYDNVQWPCYDGDTDDETCTPMEAPPQAEVVIVHYKNEGASLIHLNSYDGGQRIRHRAWFPEFETYKRGVEPLPLGDFFKGLVSGDAWSEWWDYFAYRKLGDDKPLGSEDSVVFIQAPASSTEPGRAE